MDHDYDAAIIEEFRASNGRVGGSWAGYVVILIHQVVPGPRWSGPHR